MFYVKTDGNNKVVQYPYTLTDLKFDNPNTSFSDNIDDETMAAFNVFPVQPSNPPEIDHTKNLIRKARYKNKTWKEVWTVIDATEEEINQRKKGLVNYKLFWNLLIASPLYQKIRTQACSDLKVNTCYTEFIAAITDAKYGKANSDAIQTSINLLLDALTLDENDLIELQKIMSKSKLDLIYTINN